MIRPLLVAGGGIALAVAALLLTFAQAGAAINPVFAARLGPASGPVQGVLAATIAKTRSVAAGKVVFPPEALALAQAAYRREPLSSHAATILAGRMAVDNPRAALAVQEAVNRNTRRNTDLSVQLLSSYARLGKSAEGLSVLDVLLRRQTLLHRDLLGIMSLEVRRKQLLGEFRQLLARKPPWSDQFWRQLAQSPEGLANAAALRRAFAQDGGRVDPEVDALLIGGLAQAGYYEAAEDLAATSFPNAVVRPGNLLRNGDFGAKPVVSPLDWEIRENSDFGASIDNRRNVLAVSAVPGARGEAGRQLVRLSAGKVAVSMELAGRPETGDARWLGLSLDCAGSKGEAGRVLLATTFASPGRRIVSDPCRWAWLRLTLTVPVESEGLELEVRRITITPVDDRTEASKL